MNIRKWASAALLFFGTLACNLSFTVPAEVSGPPPLIFIAPENNSQIAEGATIQIAVRVQDLSGPGVARVDFAVDDQALGSLLTANGQGQKTFTALQIWTATGARGHLITATAYRADNTQISSANITVNVIPLTVQQPTTGVIPTVQPSASTVTSPPSATSAGPTSPPPPPSQAQAKITTVFLNVRSGPGATYNSLGVVKAGDIVTILGRNEDRTWWAIQSQTGLRGWILNNPAYIDISGNTANVPLAASRPSPTPAAGSPG